MFSYSGWIKIPDGAEGDMKLIYSAYTKLDKDPHPYLLDSTMTNAELQYSIMGYANHKGGDWPSLFNFFKVVAAEFPEAYGLLYYWDDEDKNGHEDVFQVYALRRGKLFHHIDPFLSPCSSMLDLGEEDDGS